MASPTVVFRYAEDTAGPGECCSFCLSVCPYISPSLCLPLSVSFPIHPSPTSLSVLFSPSYFPPFPFPLSLSPLCLHISSNPPSRSGELRAQKLKSHPRTQSLRVLPLKSGVGQYIAMHATLTARDFFFANIYPFGPFTCIFSKPSPKFSLC